MGERKFAFEPVFDENSKVLILGSFPSVKSREVSFYYGNKQNRFWKMLCGYFKENIPDSVEEKRAFLLKNNVALWDMIDSCEIDGSADVSVKNETLVDLNVVLSRADIRKILLNGSLAYDLFLKAYDGDISYKKMTSTSPANPRYDEGDWHNELSEIFSFIK